MAHALLFGAAGERHLLLGNEAIVRGAIEAGVQVVTCYPGTPSSEVPDNFYRIAADGGFHFEYSTNEKVALEVAGGASLAGALALTTMKHVGLNVAADPLMTLCYTGTPGGLVVLSADDPGCHSSQNEQDNRYYARLAGLPCLEPSTAQEAKDMTREALLMSRRLGAPVLLRTTTRINHLRGPVVFGPLEELPPAKGLVKDPARYVPVPAFARPMHARLLQTLERLRSEAEASKFNSLSGHGRLGVAASGVCRAYLSDALDELGVRDGFKVLELGFSHPLPRALALEFLKGLGTLLVLEELEPVLENDLRVLIQEKGLQLGVVGKSGFLPRNGEYTVALVENALCSVLGETGPKKRLCNQEPGLPTRPPNLCAGCPHRATYFAARKVFGDRAVYSSDIGCYTLGILPPLRAADFLLCMGSSISAGSGAAKAAGQTVVAFIGDSTFFHSGLTGLVNAVFNGHDLLVVVMDNGTTAMTGHQPNPGVEKTALADNPHRVDIEAVCRGCGVEHVLTVNPLKHQKTVEAFERLRDLPGVRVLVAREPCPLFARQTLGARPKTTAYVTEACEGRGRCLNELACPAIYRREDGRAEINAQQCTGCMLCVQICEHIKARKR
ncbi:MAG: indolepyruvate ferredoxin oxidoreductase subunit alpha [Desulfovibrionaceae bacterium]|nr:indolepyruvate ferredoxin oxidoreductase subunit alpha [Desulfovibrionaceae bacterium]